MSGRRARLGARGLGGVAGSLGALILASCSDPAPPPARAKLEGATVARVGDEVITSDMVSAIARAQGVPAQDALNLAIFDALAANEARASGLDVRERRRVSGALARVLVEDLAAEARALGPPTDAEVEELTAQRWIEVARPEGIMPVHAVIPIPKDADPALVERATSLAKNVQKAVAPAVELASRTQAPDNLPRRGLKPPFDPAREEFLKLASQVRGGDLEVRAEPLDLIGRDGVTINHDRRDLYDPEFVAAAFKLDKRGALSEPSRSSFGVHIILVLDRLPGSELSLEERRKHFEVDVMHRRAASRVEALLSELRASTPVEQDAPTLEGLLEQVELRP